MDKTRAAMQQALEALEEAYENGFLTGITGLKTIDTLTTLREALGNSLKRKCFADYQPNHAIDRACVSCAVAVECQTGEQSEQEKPYADKAAMFAQLGVMVRIDPVTGDVGIGTPPKTLDYVAPVQKAEQGPVAWGRVFDGDIIDCICPEEHALNEGDYTIPLYAAPVRTKDLTDDEIFECYTSDAHENTPKSFARAVIAADREKNK